MTRFLLLLAFLHACSSTLAQVTVQPTQARPFETVRVVVGANVIGQYGSFLMDQWDFRETRISMAGNKIVVSLLMGETDLHLGAGGSNPLDYALGSFPAGQYEVEVTRRAKDGRSLPNVGSATFTVASRAYQDPTTDMSGLWWTPELSGNGMTLTQSGHTLFATWYVFDVDRRPVWYVVSDARWHPGHMFVGTVQRVTGPDFAPCHHESCPFAFLPAEVRRETVGMAYISPNPYFSRSMIAELVIDGRRYVRFMQRFEF